MATLLLDNGTEVTYTEAIDSLQESYVNDTIRASRVFNNIAWGDRWRFIYEMIGYSYVDESEGSGYPIHRVVPKYYPLFTKDAGKPFLWAKQVPRIRGEGLTKDETWHQGLQVGKPTNARIEIGYETLTHAVFTDDQMSSISTDGTIDESTLARFVTKAIQPSSEYLTFPRGAYKWVTDPVAAVDNSNGRVISFLEVTYIWHQVPGIPTSLATTIGTVNDATFDGAPAETLLLVGCNLKPYRNIVGARVYDIEYKCRFFNPSSGIGHNHFLRFVGDGTTPFYDRMTSNGLSGGDPVFAKKDFTKLFKSPLTVLLRDF